jgi:hypothetical protein
MGARGLAAEGVADELRGRQVDERPERCIGESADGRDGDGRRFVTVVDARNSPARRAALRTPRRPANQTATVFPEPSVASRGLSPH